MTPAPQKPELEEKNRFFDFQALELMQFTPYFFLFSLLALVGAFLYVISPFFYTIIYAALLAVIFQPVRLALVQKYKWKNSWASMMTVLLFMTLLLAPFTLFLVFLVQEALNLYANFNVNLESWDVVTWIQSVPEASRLLGFVERFDLDWLTYVKSSAETASTYLVNWGASTLLSMGSMFLHGVILLLTMFYFLKDGDKMIAYFRRLSPLPVLYEDQIQNKLKTTTQAIVIGSIGTAILQGLTGMLGLLIAGVPNAVFWGTMMVFCSLIPYVGASLVWGPLAIALLLQGDTSWGLFLFAWGMGLVASVDNFARPYLIGNAVAVHPLSTFLVVIGGILVFGFHGIVLGPLILSLVVTLIHIYELEYKDVLSEEGKAQQVLDLGEEA